MGKDAVTWNESTLLALWAEKRHRLGWSLRRLGQHIGIAFSSLSRIERGVGQPDTHTRLRLEAWLDEREPVPCPCARCHPLRRVGWQCPGCGRCYAPHVEQCRVCGEGEKA